MFTLWEDPALFWLKGAARSVVCRLYKFSLVLLLLSCSGSYSPCQCVGSEQICQDSLGEIMVVKIFFRILPMGAEEIVN